MSPDKARSKRLADAIHFKGCSQLELANAVGVSRSAVNLWLHGGKIKEQHVPAVAEYLGVSPGFLLFGIDDAGTATVHLRASSGANLSQVRNVVQPSHLQASRARDAAPGDYVDVTSMKLSASKDLARVFDAHVEAVAHIAIAQDWIRRHTPANVRVEDLGIVTAPDGSMAPTISEGDICLVDRVATEVRADAVYLYVLHDDLFIRRLQREGANTLRVIPDNEKFRETTMPRSDAHILGRVITRWGARPVA